MICRERAAECDHAFAAITRQVLDDMHLAMGDTVTVVLKVTEVMLIKE